MKKSSLPKILVILGQTATGKSDLAVKLAKKFNGEIISADSRQVYKGLDIGTGKITKVEMRGIPHHMIDIVSPKKTYTVAEWKKSTDKIMRDILNRNKLPIICGGTGFYIQSIVDDKDMPEVVPNKKLRKLLEKKTPQELSAILNEIDPERSKNIDLNNPVRLIRAIEIVEALGSVPKQKNKPAKYDFLQIGLKPTSFELKKRIKKRLLERVETGMIDEGKTLSEKGLSWKRMMELGLEYRYLALLLSKKITEEEFIEKLGSEIIKYSKRQMTWFKKDERIHWFKLNEITKVEKFVSKFLTK